MKTAKLLVVSALSIMAFAWPVLAQTTGNTTGTTGNTTGNIGNTTGGIGNTTGGIGNTTGGIGNTTGGIGNTTGGIGNTTGAIGNTTGSTTGTTGSVAGTTPGITVGTTPGTTTGANSGFTINTPGFTTGTTNLGINGNVNIRTNNVSINNNVVTRTNQATGAITTITNNVTTVNQSLVFDRRFLTQAAQGSLQEVSFGQLAQANSQNVLVQQFGALLVEDNTAAFAQAVALAQSLGFNVTTSLTQTQLRTVQRFANVTGTTFDNTFINLTVRNHILDIQTYEVAAQRAVDPSVRAYARAQLSILMEHLAMALEIREPLGLTGLATAAR